MADEKPTTFETRLQRRIRDRAQMSPTERARLHYAEQEEAKRKTAKAVAWPAAKTTDSPREPREPRHEKPLSIPSSPRRVQMVLASEVVERAIEWLWKNFLPKGYLALVSGDPGTGKSHVAEDLAARVTRGAQMPDGSTVEPGSVIFLTVEEGTADVLVPRLRVAGADLGRVCIITGTIQPDRPEVELLTNLKDDLSVIESALPEWEKETGLPCRLLVVDPIMNHLGGVNPNKEGDVRPLMAEIAAFLQRTGIAMLGIRHLNKDESKSLMYRGGGSMAFTGAARAEFLVGADREDPGRVVLDRIKGNLSRKPDPLAYRIAEAEGGITRIEWLGRSEKGAEDVISGGRDKDDSKFEQAKKLLLSLLGEGQEVSAEDCLAAGAAHGVGANTMRATAKALGVSKDQKGFHGGWCWSLTEDAP